MRDSMNRFETEEALITFVPEKRLTRGTVKVSDPTSSRTQGGTESSLSTHSCSGRFCQNEDL